MKLFSKLIVIGGAVALASACKNLSSKPNDSERNSEKSQIVLGGSWAGYMHSMRGSIQSLTPYMYNSREFESPKNEKFIRQEIHNLAKEAVRINHDASLVRRDPTVNFVSISFKEDMNRIEQAFSEGKMAFARYQLMRMTAYCVECHTRTGQGNEFNFVKLSSFPAEMNAENKIEVLIASRNYNKAFEESLRAAKNDNPALDMEKAVLLGLQVAVQYQNDLDNSYQIIKALEANKNISYYLKNKTKKWENSLNRWKRDSWKENGINLSRRLLKREDKNEIEAMRSLHALLPLLTGKLAKEELGEALFLAGSSYELLDGVSVSYLNENYYETCILRVPHTQWAKACYKNLEDSIAVGYSGSGGTHIPVDVQIKLDKLKVLTEAELKK